jgi:hypothetical protein
MNHTGNKTTEMYPNFNMRIQVNGWKVKFLIFVSPSFSVDPLLTFQLTKSKPHFRHTPGHERFDPVTPVFGPYRMLIN